MDVCCLSRLTDDQSQTRIREEAEAVEQVIIEVQRGNVELTSSEALEDECGAIRRWSAERKRCCR